ncbi:MAG: SdrD B-like domain-containing protein [Methanothrix sp.]
MAISVAGAGLCISGYKLDDCTKAGLSGWTVTLSNGSYTVSQTTDGSGKYQFCGLSPSTYTVWETIKSGWSPSTTPFLNVNLITNLINKNFTNSKHLCISGYKRNNCDGAGLSGWTVTLSNGSYTVSQTTDGSGKYQFCGLLPGAYTIWETVKSGWTASTSPILSLTLSCNTDLTNQNFRNQQLMCIPIIALRAANGQYVCAEGGGGDGVVANRNAIGGWETFKLIDRGSGNVALQAANGKYLCAEGGGGGAVVANRNAIGAWETFKLIDRGNGYFALQAANGQYLCAEGGGGGAVVANRNAIGAWETFRFMDLRRPAKVALRAANNQYVCAEGGGGDGVVANRNAIGQWETFKLIDRGNGNVALQAANNQYVCAEGGGGGAVVANRNAIGAWETFGLLYRGNGNVALQAANGKYVCAEGGGGDGVVANRNSIGAWETFNLIPT